MAKSLSAQKLVKSFKGRRVVDGVSVAVSTGEVVGLLGPNGAGKTTTFYMITGLLRPESGSVYMDSTDITGLPMHERSRMGIGYLAQEPSVFRKLTVEENILAILEFTPLDGQARRERLNKLSEELGIAHLAKVKALSLSGGERRRVEIARALVSEPSFFLLDEPFSGIDPKALGEIEDMVAELKRKNIGVLITDHNVSATLRICDRAYIIDKGAILLSGAPQEILESKKVREVYLGERFRL